jgi:hypothetical protein
MLAPPAGKRCLLAASSIPAVLRFGGKKAKEALAKKQDSSSQTHGDNCSSPCNLYTVDSFKNNCLMSPA